MVRLPVTLAETAMVDTPKPTAWSGPIAAAHTPMSATAVPVICAGEPSPNNTVLSTIASRHRASIPPCQVCNNMV